MSSPPQPPPASSPPSQPVGIARSPRRDELLRSSGGTPDPDAANASAQAALAAYLNPGGISPPPNIPPRIASSSSMPRVSQQQGLPISASPRLGGGSPGSFGGFPSSLTRSGRSSPSPFLSDTVGAGDVPSRGRTPLPPVDLETLPDEEKARILRRHLVSREERGESATRRGSTNAEASGSRPNLGFGVHFPSNESALVQGGDESSGAPTPRAAEEEGGEFPIPYDQPGADVTHSIYKWQSNAQRESLKRTRTTSEITRHVETDPRFQHIHEPGGFRRNYLMMKADERGEAQPPPMLNNFIDFLYIFGHFGGEDLEEDEEEEDELAEDEDIRRRIPSTSARSPAEAGLRIIQEEDLSPDLTIGKSPTDERRPLLPRSPTTTRSMSRRRKRSMSAHAQGDATVTQAVLMLLKSFIGTGILFLGKAFFNGGILFSALTLAFIALISLYSFILLVNTKFVVQGSFGDLGGILYGKWMRFAILFSIVLSQLGFVSAYTIFIASNFQSFIQAVSNCRTLVPIQYLIFAQAIVLLPLSLVRDLAKLSWTALVADGFILIGLVYIASQEVAVIAQRGIADVALFNPKSFPLLIGTAVFSFEGIGLVIPITDAMREPRKFPKVLSGVMFFLMFLFGGAGVLSYLAYGSEVQTVILVNLPSDQKFVQVVQVLYASAILLSTPLQLFPAVRIMENAFFEKAPSGKMSMKTKWEKNAFRACTVLVCYGVSYVASNDLDKFVSFIGSFACIPLCYVYPAMLHYKAVARTRRAKIADIALMVFGLAAAVFTTVQTIKLMIEPGDGEGPQFGVCSPAQPGDPTLWQTALAYMGW